MPGDDHIIYCQNIVSGWHNHRHNWIHTEKPCIMHTVYIHMNQRNYQIWLVWSQNGHSHWIHIEKLVQNIYCTIAIDSLPMWHWHAWRNFHFVTWLLGVWQGPDFVRCQTEAGYFSHFWLSLRWNMQRRAAAEAKFTRLWTKCPNLDQNCCNEVCHIFWPFIRTLRDTVTQLIFRHVRYPLWRVTDESIEIVQYFIGLHACFK